MFLAVTIVFMAAWASMFTSPVYRVLILTWNSFATTSITAMILMVVTLLLAMYSWFHLDVGLAEYCECSVSPFVPQVLNISIVKAEEPPHPADKLRWSLAVPSDPEKGGSPTSEDVMSKPKVTWVRLPSPTISKPSTAAQKAARSYSTRSAPTKGSKRSHLTSNGIASKLIKARSVSGERDPYSYPPPPPGLMPPPYGLPVIPISTASDQASPPVPVSERTAESEQIPPPPQAVARGLPALLETTAADRIIADDIVIPERPPLDAPRAVGRRLPPVVIGLPPSVKPSQRNWL